MVELQHGPVPLELTEFRTNNPHARPDEFDSSSFSTVKHAVRVSLHRDQGGLCAYCECKLKQTGGQVDHIKPKGGPNQHQHLCFEYSNYAYSCIKNQTCGQKKKSGLLPIEPAVGCNSQWSLSTDGTIQPLKELNRQQKHNVTKTRDMLGLNKDPGLVDDRKRVFLNAMKIAESSYDDLNLFLADQPFRYIISSNFF